MGLRAWWARRKKARYDKYVKDRGFLDEKTIDRLREQQSPLRGRGRRRI